LPPQHDSKASEAGKEDEKPVAKKGEAPKVPKKSAFRFIGLFLFLLLIGAAIGFFNLTQKEKQPPSREVFSGRVSSLAVLEVPSGAGDFPESAVSSSPGFSFFCCLEVFLEPASFELDLGLELFFFISVSQ